MKAAETKRHALIVEDEALISLVAAEALEELGFESVEVSSAKAAMDQLRSTNFDVALVDLGLPDQRGDKLVEDLRTLHSDLPVIIATGYCDRDLHERFRSAPHLVILDKPYDIAQLHAAIAALAIR